MQLDHSFTVPVGIDDAWRVLLDIELIAPCMPGAAIDSVNGDDFTGTVKVKLGPIGLTYKGKASFVEKDEITHRAVIDARGRDARGNGTASAKVTATLTESGGSTKVDVRTDLDITGKPAQFGRGVMADVGNKLIGQFADCLAGKLTDGAAPAAAAQPTAAPKLAAVASEAPAAAPRPRPRPRPRKTAAATATPGGTTSRTAEPGGAGAAGTPEPGGMPAAVPEPPPATEPAAAEPTAPPMRSVPPVPEPSMTTPSLTTPSLTTPSMSTPSMSTPSMTTPSMTPHGAASRPRAAEVEPINLIESAGPALAKRLLPLVAVLLVALLALRRLRRR